ncbi:MAG: hypothetical protein ACYS8W_18575 [Planctomycetota bacterium]|jgi:hypothetical protein
MRPRRIFLLIICIVSLIAFVTPGCKGKSKKDPLWYLLGTYTGPGRWVAGTAYGPLTQLDTTVQVIDRVTGSPISGAQVDIDSSAIQLTNSTGFTTFAGATGEHIITATAAGYDISTVAFVGLERLTLEIGLLDPTTYFSGGPQLTLSVMGVNQNDGDTRVKFLVSGRDPAVAGLKYPELQLFVNGTGTSPENISVTLPNGSIPFGITALVYDAANDLVKIGSARLDTGIGTGAVRAIQVDAAEEITEAVSGVIDIYDIQMFKPDPYNADAAVYAVGPQGEFLAAGGFNDQFDSHFNFQVDAIRHPGISKYRFAFGIEDGIGGKSEAFVNTVGIPTSFPVYPPDLPFLIAPKSNQINVPTRVPLAAWGFPGISALAIEITDIPSGDVVTYRWRGIIHPAHTNLLLPVAAELQTGTKYRIRAVGYAVQGYDFNYPAFAGDATFTNMADGRAEIAWRTFTTEY